MRVFDLLKVIYGDEKVVIEIIDVNGFYRFEGLARNLLFDKRIDGLFVKSVMHEVENFDFTKVSICVVCVRGA